MKRIPAAIAVLFFLLFAMVLLVSQSPSASGTGRDLALPSQPAARMDSAAAPVGHAVLTQTPEVFLPAVFRSYHPQVTWEFRGASVAGYWSSAFSPAGNSYDTIDYLADLGANSVSLVVTWYQDDLTSNDMYADPRLTVSDDDLAALIDYAHSRGLKVMLKPHVDPLHGDPLWRGAIRPSDRKAWFQNLGAFLVQYAELAQEHEVEMFSIGAEYDAMTVPTETLPVDPWQAWAGIVTSVTQVYSGPITYAATEGRLKDTTKDPIPASFWQSLDYAALTVYFDVSRDRTPQVADLVDAWNSEDYLGFLEDWQAEHGMPVLFAEIGYRSVDYAGYDSYVTEGPNGCDPEDPNPPNFPECSIAYNGQGQANLYEALFEAMGRQPWLAGIFTWQFEPRAGCQEITGGVGNIDYSFYGKPAAQVIHNWFSGGGQAPALTFPDLTSPLIDHFDYLTPEEAQNAWLVQSSGDITLTPVITTYAPVAGNARSLRVDSHVPAADPRYAQLVGYFCEGQRDWSGYNSLELWVRSDGLSGEPSGGEFSVALIDSRGTAREIWQSTRYLDRRWVPGLPDGWSRIRIALSGSGVDDPWRHPTDFVVPPWETPQNGLLDLNAIRGVWIKSLTATDPEQYPDFRVWVDEAKGSTDTVPIIPPPVLPVLDSFEYADADGARFMWKRNPDFTGTITLNMDTAVKAPVRDTTRSMTIDSNVPCGAGNLAGVTNYLLGGPLDLSAYQSLDLWVRGDQVKEAPYGGEFSVIVIDRDGEHWQSTRWIDRTTGANAPESYQGWDRVKVSLTAGTGRNPSLHPADFVVPSWLPAGNGVLDLDQVQAVGIQSRTTDEACSQYPQSVVWVDNLKALTTTVEPPALPELPTIDPFEYKDDDIARVIWKSASSGKAVLSMDPTLYAPIPGSTRSMKIESDVPCAADRYAQVCTTFLTGTLDMSPYDYLDISVRADQINAYPYGGEFSIMLIEQGTGNPEEKWQSTRWLYWNDTWSEPISISLSGCGQGNPWDHRDDFVVPTWEQLQDGVLDLHSIKAVCIKALTTDAKCDHPDFTVWVDGLTLR